MARDKVAKYLAKVGGDKVAVLYLAKVVGGDKVAKYLAKVGEGRRGSGPVQGAQMGRVWSPVSSICETEVRTAPWLLPRLRRS